MQNRKILISGGGIAGLALGYWLNRHGFQPTIIEVAPGVRGGGYMIDFWGLGYDVAERMGIIDQLAAAHYEISTLDFVDGSNRVRGRMDIRKLRQMMDWRHFNFLRSDLENVLYKQVRDTVPVEFSRSITELRTEEDGVEVRFSDGHIGRYDLVIGADGLRSNTRRLVFGPDEQFEKFLGYYTASFTITDRVQGDARFRIHNTPGKQVGLYPVAENKLATFFLFSAPQPLPNLPLDAQKQKLREVFRDVGWETPQILSQMDSSTDFYFDAVSQVRMPSWSSGRIALAGDAGHCVSLIAGQGSGLAMAGAYILAGELKRAGGNYGDAFERYHALLKPEILRKQEMAQRFAASFIPSSHFGIRVRNTFVRLMFLPILSRYFIRRFLSDELRLGTY